MQQQPMGGKLRVYFQEGPREVDLPLTPDTPFIIGRGRDAQLRFENAPHYGHVSNRHCHITMNNGYYYIADGAPGGKPSSAGTFVNGQRIDQSYRYLQPNDEINLGFGGNAVRIQFFVAPVEITPRVPSYGDVDDRPTQPHQEVPFGGQGFPPADVMGQPMGPPPGIDMGMGQPMPPPPSFGPQVDQFGMPITRSYGSAGSGGQLPGTGLIRSIQDSMGGFPLVIVLGAIVFGLGFWGSIELPIRLFENSNDVEISTLRFVFGFTGAMSFGLSWYVIGCGLSAYFPNLSGKAFSSIMSGLALVALASVYIELLVNEYSEGSVYIAYLRSSEDWVPWAVWAVFSAIIAFPLSAFDQFIAPNDKPKLKPEFAVGLFIGLIVIHFIAFDLIYTELIYEAEGDVSENEARLRFIAVGAIYGAAVVGAVWGALKASEQPKYGGISPWTPR